MREQTKQRMRDNYRKDNPKEPSALSGGLLAEGKYKEVMLEGALEGDQEPVYANAYTIKDTALALGKTVITIRRWIADELIPPTKWVCTAHGYQHYTEGELKLIAKVLVNHEKEFDYFLHTHTRTIDAIWSKLQTYREYNI